MERLSSLLKFTQLVLAEVGFELGKSGYKSCQSLQSFHL